MARPRLFWVLAASYLVVVLLCTVSLGWYAIRSVHNFAVDNTEKELTLRAQLVERQLGSSLVQWHPRDLQEFLRHLGEASTTRYTIVGPDGQVLADSQSDPSAMENHGDRPEVREALAGRTGTATRMSPTLRVRETYVAVPLFRHGEVAAVIRAAVPLTDVNRAVRSLYIHVAVSAGIIAVVAAALGLYLSRRLSLRMRLIRDGAARLAAGDFHHTIESSRTQEFGAVAESLNAMARQLDQKIRAISDQKNEREAILSSMVEGVVAVDTDERVITMNRAAAALLGVDPSLAQRRSIQEVVRNPDLQRLVGQALAHDEPVEEEILLRTPAGDRFLQVNGSSLRDTDGRGIGAIAVLNDVTRLKALERMRREFVANVSHEIKTPVTAIKGFAETLLDGASDDPGAAQRFLRIIVGQADRLASIVEDLLALSSVEQAKEGDAIELREAGMGEVLQAAVEVCEPKALAKGITVRLDASPVGVAGINPPLLEQAVANLIDNAVKYSPEGSTVEVTQRLVAGEVVICVRDEGIGIAREYLPHLFERFYRVDKARSRAVGGTGLGLAIVKHIAEAHHGRVSVESTPGKGSVFCIHLPAVTVAGRA